MSRVLVRKAEGGGGFLGPSVQTNVMGQGSPFFITPKEPISPQQAGMDAANRVLDGTQGPLRTQAVQDSATRGAQRATGLVQGEFGMPSLGMLGLAGLKNIYNASVQGQAPSITGTLGDAYGMAQYAQPFAAAMGARMGAASAMRAPEPQVEASVPDDYEFDAFVRDPILPRTAEGVAEQAAEQLREGATPASIGRAGLNVTHSMRPEFQGFGNMFDAVEQEQLERDNRTRGNVGYLDQRGRRTFGGSSAGYRDALNRPQPSELVSVTRAPPTPMSTGRARNVLAGRTRDPIDTGGFDASGTPTGEGEQTSMADFGTITGGFASKVNESLKQQQEEQMKEQQEKQEEEQEEREKMNQEQQAKLNEELREKTNMQSTGA